MGHAPGHHLGQQEVRRVIMMMVVIMVMMVIMRYGGPDIYVTENGCSSKISNLDDLSR